MNPSSPPPLPEKHRTSESQLSSNVTPPQLPQKMRRITDEEINAKLGITSRRCTHADGSNSASTCLQKHQPVALMGDSATTRSAAEQILAPMTSRDSHMLSLHLSNDVLTEKQETQLSMSKGGLTSPTGSIQQPKHSAAHEGVSASSYHRPPFAAVSGESRLKFPTGEQVHEATSDAFITNVIPKRITSKFLSSSQVQTSHVSENVSTGSSLRFVSRDENAIVSSSSNSMIKSHNTATNVIAGDRSMLVEKSQDNAWTTHFQELKILPEEKVFQELETSDKDVNHNHMPVHSEECFDAGFDSEDGLSDGGDYFDDTEFSLPSTPVICKSIPIIPATPHSMKEKKGFLFKYTRQSNKGDGDESARTQSGKMGINKIRDELQKRWHKRWAVVDEKSLKYYSNNKSYVSKRIIPICTIKNIEQDIKDLSDAHPYRFRIATGYRVYYFATETVDELSLWSSVLMCAVIDAKRSLSLSSVSLKEGGDMNAPNMMGYARMEGRRRFLVIKLGKFCFYETESDFKHFCPIHEVELQLSNVKDIGKCKLQLSTPQTAFIITFETQEELNTWKTAFEVGISYALGDDKVLGEIYRNANNAYCADCRAEAPEWAAINMGITICHRCAGVHRKLANAKVRSLRMDSKVWTDSLVQLMIAIGNENANKFWEWNIKDEDRIDPEADMTSRSNFIQRKYQDKQFCNYQLLEPLDEEMLCENILKNDDVLKMMRLVFSADDTSCTNKGLGNFIFKLFQLTQDAKNYLQTEFLFQNGADSPQCSMHSKTSG